MFKQTPRVSWKSSVLYLDPVIGVKPCLQHHSVAQFNLTTDLMSWDDLLAHWSNTCLPNADFNLHYVNVHSNLLLKTLPINSYPRTQTILTHQLSHLKFTVYKKQKVHPLKLLMLFKQKLEKQNLPSQNKANVSYYILSNLELESDSSLSHGSC